MMYKNDNRVNRNTNTSERTGRQRERESELARACQPNSTEPTDNTAETVLFYHAK